MTITLTTRSRELHEHREALIAAFLESRNLPHRDRNFIDEIIEADRDWCQRVEVERLARQIARAGS